RLGPDEVATGKHDDIVDVATQVELGAERQQDSQCETRAQHLERLGVFPGGGAVVALARHSTVRGFPGGLRLHCLPAPTIRPAKCTCDDKRRARSPSRRVGCMLAQATAAALPKISRRLFARVMPV